MVILNLNIQMGNSKHEQNKKIDEPNGNLEGNRKVFLQVNQFTIEA
jgi:hypothetical protein